MSSLEAMVLVLGIGTAIATAVTVPQIALLAWRTHRRERIESERARMRRDLPP